MQTETALNLVDALGWTLVHFLWQGAALAVVYALLCRLAPARAVRWRYAVGLGTYLAMVVLPVVTFFHHLPAGGVVTLHTAAVTAAPVLGTPGLATGYPVSAAEMLRQGLAPAMPAIVSLWMLGVCFMSARAAAGWFGARRLLRDGVASVGAPLRRLSESLQRRLGLRRAVRVLASSRTEVPTVIGWLNPVVLLPLGVIAGLPREQLMLVLAHELVHVRRNDYLVNLLQLVVETLFFYHPAVAWVGRRVRADRELCCDDTVVAQFGQRVCYARALARLEHLRAPGAPALAATGGDLYRRVDRIVHCEPPRRSAGFAHVAFVTVLAGAAAFGLNQGLQRAQESARGALVAPTPVMPTALPVGALGDGWRRHGREELARQAAQREREAARLEAIRLGAVRRAADRSDETRVAKARPQGARSEPSNAAAEAVAPSGTAAPVAPMPTFEPEAPAPELAAAASEPVAPKPEPPSVLRQVAPDYPFRAERAGVEGEVRVAFTVDERGRPRNVSVVDAQPSGVFERAAEKAMARWRFDTASTHDPDQVYEQVFEFATRVERTDQRRPRRCNRTGSNICGRHYDEASVRHYDGSGQPP